jgi:primosomal protein N'
MIAEVIVNMGGSDLLDYKIPESLDTDLSGRRVVVPLGSKEVMGLVYKQKQQVHLKN